MRSHRDLARIEVDVNDLHLLAGPGLHREGVVGKLKELGYAYVTIDLQGYRTGSLNETLNRER